MPLFLGPLGKLRELRAPRPDFEVTAERQGGTHVALSGARTVDYLGNRRTFPFTWHRLSNVDRDYLEALRDRHVRGPLRFVLPGWRHNRLSRSAASLGYGGRDMTGVTVSAGSVRPSPQWPDDAPPGGDGLVWSSWSNGDTVRLDRHAPAPVLPGETVTASLFVYSARADVVRLVLDHHGPDGDTGRTDADPATLTPGSWVRLSVTAAPGRDVWAVSPALLAVERAAPDSELVLAAAQIDAAPTTSAWSPGGGAPVVVVDSAPITATRAGWSNATVTLLEV